MVTMIIITAAVEVMASTKCSLRNKQDERVMQSLALMVKSIQRQSVTTVMGMDILVHLVLKAMWKIIK